jgi:hypothetical protein
VNGNSLHDQTPAGTRNFLKRDRATQPGVSPSRTGPQTKFQRAKPANSALFGPSPGNSWNGGTAWWGREDSNLQPDRYREISKATGANQNTKCGPKSQDLALSNYSLNITRY